MTTSTYTPLATQTLGSASATVTFSSIPAGYTDLILVTKALGTGNYYLIQINGDAGTNYSRTRLVGDGTSATSSRTSSTSSLPINDLSSTIPDATIIQFQNYANTTTYKTFIYRANTASASATVGVGLWRATPAAITSITLYTDTATFAIGSTFSLYGISAAPSAKATGGMITSDATYYYHTFTSTGTFTPTQSLSADILVVAGGGSGAGGRGAGGGAGGLLAFTSQSLTATGYTCTVGGGAAINSGNVNGNQGSNSQFGALTASVGGGYGTSAFINGNGGTGGSGGGAPGGGTGGTPTSGQGYAGGNGATTSTNYRGTGGGGGAGAVGQNGYDDATPGGAGGNGLNTYSSWATATGTGVSGYYAGGGGGGTYNAGTASGGLGGGGTANTSAGTANTGGGGGGASQNGGSTLAYAGGSGIVIVRYAK